MTSVRMSTFNMLWLASLIVLAFAQSVFGAQVASVYHRNPGPTCKNFRTEEDLGIDFILGVWYEAENDPTNIICVDFELLTDQYKDTLTDELGLDQGAFEDYTLQVHRQCPGVTFNNTKEFHVWKKLEEKGVYRSVIIRNDTVKWDSYRALVGKFSYEGKEYIGVVEVPTQRFIVILSRVREDYYEEQYHYNLFNCFCELSTVCQT